MNKDPLLSIKNLKTYFYDQTTRRFLRVVDGVSFNVNRGETIAVFGESGSGKTRMAYSIMGLVPHTPGVVEGEIWYYNSGGRENLLYGLDQICSIENGRNNEVIIKKDVSRWNNEFGYERRMKGIRGREISLVPQGAKSALNPFQRIRDQIAESYLLKKRNKQEMKDVVNNILDRLGLRDKADDYPHRLSGGMCRRAVIALGLASDPALLIADEPTNGIDSSLKIKVIELLMEFKERQRSILLITHEIDAVRLLADKVVVMCAGRVVESGDIDLILAGKALHPYTRRLIEVASTNHRPLLYISGDMPDPWNLPIGCKFYQRCEEREKGCLEREPELLKVPGTEEHWVRCHKCIA